MSVIVTARIPEATSTKVDALASAMGRTKSWIATEAIRRYVEVESWQVAEIKEALKEADAGDFATPAEAARIIKRLKRRAG